MIPTWISSSTLLVAATAVALYHAVAVAAVDDTVITYPGAGVQWNTSDLFHNIVWDVNKIPSGYLEDAVLELHHESFTQPMNLASNVNVTQCHKLIPVPAVNDSDTYQVVMIVNYPVGTFPSSSSMEIGPDGSETALVTVTTNGSAAGASSRMADGSATSTNNPPSTATDPSSPTMSGMRRRHAMPNPYPYPNVDASTSVTTVTSLATTTTTILPSSSSATVDASAAYASAAAALSSASLAMASASAAMESASAAVSASVPTSGLSSASPGTTDSNASTLTATSGETSQPTATTIDGSGMPSGTNTDTESATMGGQGGLAPTASMTGTTSAAQTTSTSFVGACFTIHQNDVRISSSAPVDASPTMYALDH